MKLIVGLGNPGKEYENTRHNIGFMAIDQIAKYFDVSVEKEMMNGKYTSFYYQGDKVFLLKPQTYMNLSGESVIQFVQYYNIKISNILIISDDLDLNVGSFKLRYKGSAGGHNGLKSIEQHLHTQEYKRLKIGISKNPLWDTKDYVLGKFTQQELHDIQKILVLTPHIIEDFCDMSFDKLMSRYNKK